MIACATFRAKRADVELTAELPGREAKDVGVTLADNILTIRGEKKAEKEEKQKDYQLLERSIGSFYQSLREIRASPSLDTSLAKPSSAAILSIVRFSDSTSP